MLLEVGPVAGREIAKVTLLVLDLGVHRFHVDFQGRIVVTEVVALGTLPFPRELAIFFPHAESVLIARRRS